MSRAELARRLEALEAALRPPSLELRDILTAEEEAFLWKLAGEAPSSSPIRCILAGDERGAAILAKLDVQPRPWCSFVLLLSRDDLGL